MSGVAMMMPGMDIQNGCMPDRGSPGKQAPCKSTDNSCSVCTGCAVNVGLAANFSLAALLYQGDTGQFVADTKPDGLMTAPALPPPILHA